MPLTAWFQCKGRLWKVAKAAREFAQLRHRFRLPGRAELRLEHPLQPSGDLQIATGFSPTGALIFDGEGEPIRHNSGGRHVFSYAVGSYLELTPGPVRVPGPKEVSLSAFRVVARALPRLTLRWLSTAQETSMALHQEAVRPTQPVPRLSSETSSSLSPGSHGTWTGRSALQLQR